MDRRPDTLKSKQHHSGKYRRIHPRSVIHRICEEDGTMVVTRQPTSGVSTDLSLAKAGQQITPLDSCKSPIDLQEIYGDLLKTNFDGYAGD